MKIVNSYFCESILGDRDRASNTGGGGTRPESCPCKAWTFDPQILEFIQKHCRRGSNFETIRKFKIFSPPLIFGDLTPPPRKTSAKPPRPPKQEEKSPRFAQINSRPCPSFPCFFWEFLVFSPCVEFLACLSVLPFFSRDFRGSVRIKNPCFFGGFPCLSPKKQGKGRIAPIRVANRRGPSKGQGCAFV